MSEITAERCEELALWYDEDQGTAPREVCAALRAHAAAIRECKRIVDSSAFQDGSQSGDWIRAIVGNILTLLRGTP
jgi:hypothetical protein